jgi:hypothetical protein
MLRVVALALSPAATSLPRSITVSVVVVVRSDQLPFF